MPVSKDLAYNLTGTDVSASKTMSAFAENAEHATGRIGGAFSQVGGIIGGEFGEIMNKAGEGIERLGEGTRKWSGAMVLGGTIATGLGVAMMAMGSADKQASDQLKQSVVDSGHSWEAYKGGVEEAITSQENYGHSAVDTQTALQKLTQATNDPQKALDLMGVTANLAAARHVSLADASTLVSKIVNGGGARTLKEYGVVMATTGDKTKNAQDALVALSGKLDGQAAASMDNFGGFVASAKAKIEDFGAKLGQIAGPVLTVLGPAMMTFGTILDIVKGKQAAHALALAASTVATAENATVEGAATATMVAAGVAADGTAVALGVEAAATDVATGSTLALAAAWLLTPVGLITAGLVAVVGVIAAVTLGTGEATQATDDYSKSLTADNNVLGENTRLQVLKSLVDSGAIDAAKILGISTEELTQAALGNAPAMAHVASVSKDATDKLNAMADGTDTATNATIEQIDAQQKFSDAGLRVSSAIGKTSSSIALSTEKMGAYSDITGVTAGSSEALAQGLGLTTDAFASLAASQDTATKASKDYKTELDILNGGAVGLDAAQMTVLASAGKMADGVAAAMKAASAVSGESARDAAKAGAVSMDVNTKLGAANHDNVMAMIADNAAMGVALVKSGDGSTASQNAANKAVRDGETALKNAATAAGLNGDAVQAMIDRYGKIPPNIVTHVRVDTTDAEMSIQTLANHLSFSRSEDMTPAKHATGGTVMGAGSGISDSVPIMASTGEEIIGATAAAKWRPLLKDINAGRTPTLPGSGGGGGGGVTIGTFIAQANQSAAEIATELGWIGRWAT